MIKCELHRFINDTHALISELNYIQLHTNFLKKEVKNIFQLWENDELAPDHQ